VIVGMPSRPSPLPPPEFVGGRGPVGQVDVAPTCTIGADDGGVVWPLVFAVAIVAAVAFSLGYWAAMLAR
jgi:hypothetical protein